MAGLFRRTYSDNKGSSSSSHDATASMVALLKTKIANLEDKLVDKDKVIGQLRRQQQQQHRGSHWMNKMDSSERTTATTLSLADMDESESRHSAIDEVSFARRTMSGDDSHNNEDDDDDDGGGDNVVHQLVQQVEDKNLQISSLEVQLEEQRLLNHHLEEQLKTSDESKVELVAQMQQLEKTVFDQSNQIECLQALNETNTTIVNEMDMSSSNNNSRRPSLSSANTSTREQRACAGNTSPLYQSNRWEMYGRLQRLMDTNNQLSHQLALMASQKQQADQHLLDCQNEQAQLHKTIDTLTRDLEHKQVECMQLRELKLDLDMDHGDLDYVLPEAQQSLDGDSRENTNDDTPQNFKMDPHLLQLSLQACQSKLQQVQRSQQFQLQKTVRQSVALVKAKEQVDTLTAKVEHYESILDAALIGSLCCMTTQNQQAQQTKTTGTSLTPDDMSPVSYDSPLLLGTLASIATTTATTSMRGSIAAHSRTIINPGCAIRRMILQKFIRTGA